MESTGRREPGPTFALPVHILQKATIETMPEPSPQLCTVRETARRLSCSVTNVYALLDSGQLPFVCVGNAKGYRIDLRDIEAFIDQRKRAKVPAETRSVPVRVSLKHLRLN